MGDDRRVSRTSGLFFDVARVAAFNDAVIAIAITLLVLDVRPDVERIATSAEVWHQLRHLIPNILAFAFSFWLISRFWITNLLYFRTLRKIDMNTLQYDTAFLFIIALIPFPTSLLASSDLTQASVIVYAVTLAAASLIQSVMWHRLLNRDHRAEDVSEFTVFYRVLQYGWSCVIFLFSIPLAFVNVYVAVAFWILFGFTRLFAEHSPESLRRFEDRYLERRAQQTATRSG